MKKCYDILTNIGKISLVGEDIDFITNHALSVSVNEREKTSRFPRYEKVTFPQV